MTLTCDRSYTPGSQGELYRLQPDRTSVTALDATRSDDRYSMLAQVTDWQDCSILTDLANRIRGLHIKDPEIVAPSEAAIWSAIEWVRSMYAAASDIEGTWKDPLISGNYDGQVVFEWWGVRRKLTVRIDEHEVEVSRLCGAPPDVEYEELDLQSIIKKRQVWRWITSK